ncbi:MAG: hypothetical protein FWG16_02800 [Micrococcales bacterium]|nr:hypothetical protein [Micrococcales bacterium]
MTDPIERLWSATSGVRAPDQASILAKTKAGHAAGFRPDRHQASTGAKVAGVVVAVVLVGAAVPLTWAGVNGKFGSDPMVAASPTSDTGDTDDPIEPDDQIDSADQTDLSDPSVPPEPEEPTEPAQPDKANVLALTEQALANPDLVWAFEFTEMVGFEDEPKVQLDTVLTATVDGSKVRRVQFDNGALFIDVTLTTKDGQIAIGGFDSSGDYDSAIEGDWVPGWGIGSPRLTTTKSFEALTQLVQAGAAADLQPVEQGEILRYSFGVELLPSLYLELGAQQADLWIDPITNLPARLDMLLDGQTLYDALSLNRENVPADYLQFEDPTYSWYHTLLYTAANCPDDSIEVIDNGGCQGDDQVCEPEPAVVTGSCLSSATFKWSTLDDPPPALDFDTPTPGERWSPN